MTKDTRQMNFCLLCLLSLISRCLGYTFPLPLLSSALRERHHHHRLSSTHFASKQDTPVAIEGIVDDFDRLNCLHITIQELCRQIPVLLSEPLTREQADRAYTADTRLTAGQDDIELASSLDELLALSNTFLLAVTASTRAGNLLSTFVPAAAADADTPASRFAPRVESKIILIPSELSKVVVEWETEFFSLSNADSNVAAQLVGYSELIIDAETSKIAKHRLLRVEWNGQEQDARRIGQSLATLRRSVKSVQESPLARLVGASPVAGIFDQVRNDLFQQLSASDDLSASSKAAPVFIKTDSLMDAPTGLCAIEEYDYQERPSFFANTTLALPFPGSSAWTSYAATIKMICEFVTQTIPSLSQPRSSLSISMFAPDATLITLDDTVLVRDAGRLVKFYKALASWRQRTFLQWRLEKVQLIQWDDMPTVEVEYRVATNAAIPGTARANLRGTDVFKLCVLDDKSEASARIQEIRQTRLSIGDTVQSPEESSMFFRSLATAIQTEQMGDDMYDGLWDEFLQRLTGTSSQASTASGSSTAERIVNRCDEAATRVYRFMVSLLTECPLITDQSSAIYRPPGFDYLSENISLQGYLSETLLRGRSSYERSFGISVASLKAALRSGQLVAEKPTDVKVGLNAELNVQLSLTFHFKVSPLIKLPGMDSSRLAPDGGIPLRLTLNSEYVLNPESGLVEQHRLLESRVNGQLTPGDIVSRWIQRQRGELPTQTPDDTESFMRGLVETVGWVRSFTEREKKP